ARRVLTSPVSTSIRSFPIVTGIFAATFAAVSALADATDPAPLTPTGDPTGAAIGSPQTLGTANSEAAATAPAITHSTHRQLDVRFVAIHPAYRPPVHPI